MTVNTKIHKTSTIKDKHYSNLFINNSVMSEKLGEFVKRIRREKNLSVADVSQRSNKQISTSYINKIENEPNINLSSPKILALAIGLGEPEEKIFAIARGKHPEQILIIDEIELYLNELSLQRQKDLLAIAKMFYDQQNSELQLPLPFDETDKSKTSEIDNIDGRELATHSKKKLPLDRGIKQNKRKTG